MCAPAQDGGWGELLGTTAWFWERTALQGALLAESWWDKAPTVLRAPPTSLSSRLDSKLYGNTNINPQWPWFSAES